MRRLGLCLFLTFNARRPGAVAVAGLAFMSAPGMQNERSTVLRLGRSKMHVLRVAHVRIWARPRSTQYTVSGVWQLQVRSSTLKK